MAIAAIQALHGIYVMKGCEQPLVVRFAEPKKPRMGESRHTPHQSDPSGGHNMYNEMQQMKSSPSGWRTPITPSFDAAAHAAQPVNYIAENEYPMECEWSEHVSPDGDLYYYNCVTCESRWEKPEEYALYEQELDDVEEEQDSEPEAFFSPEVLEAPEC